MAFTFKRSINQVNADVLSLKHISADYRNQMLSHSSQVGKLRTVLNFTNRLIDNGCMNLPKGQFGDALKALDMVFEVLDTDLDYTRPIEVNLPDRVVARLQDVDGITSMQIVAGNKEWKFGYDGNGVGEVFSFTN
jgi:hypothetical protein